MIMTHQHRNIIFYLTTDNSLLSSSGNYVKDNTLIGNVYQNGWGLLVYEKPVKIIENKAFYRNKKIKRMILPQGLKQIGWDTGASAGYYQQCFLECSNLVSIEIPDTVNYITGACFNYCSKLSISKLPPLITDLKEAQWGGTKISINIVPSKVAYTGLLTFDSCLQLTDLTFPKVFYSLRYSTFRGCNNIKKLRFLRTASVVTDYQNKLITLPSDVIVYVPASLQSAYQASPCWAGYTIKTLEEYPN